MIRDTGLLEVPLEVAERLGLEGERPDGTSYQAYQDCGDGLARIPRYYKAGWRSRLRPTSPVDPLPCAIALRPAQVEPVQGALSALDTDRGCFYSDRCGGGKTVVSLFMRAKLGALKTIVVVDQTNLLEQWAVRIHEHLGLDVPVGIWSGRPSFNSVKRFEEEAGFPGKLVHLDTKKDARRFKGIIVTIAQRLFHKKVPKKPIKCDLLIADEAHVFAAPRFLQSIYWFDFTYSLALSANQKRKDKMEWIFKAFLGAKIVEGTGGGRTPAKVVTDTFEVPGIREMEEYQSFFCGNWYAQVCERTCAVGTIERERHGEDKILFHGGCPRFSEFPNCGGVADVPVERDFPRGRIDAWSLLEDVYGDPVYREHVRYWVKRLRKSGRSMLVFCQTKPFAERLHRWASKKFGDDAGLYYGTMRGKKAADALAKPITIATQSKAAKGLDVPHKDSLVWALSSGDFPQIIGRIERTQEDKQPPLAILLRPRNAYAWRGRISREQDAWLKKNSYEVHVAEVEKQLARRVQRRAARRQ